MTDHDELPPEYAGIPQDQLKHGKGRYKDVILVPQPSDDPNDPLNASLPLPLPPRTPPLTPTRSGRNGAKN
jgi:hypothetical protein